VIDSTKDKLYWILQHLFDTLLRLTLFFQQYLHIKAKYREEVSIESVESLC